MMNTMPRKKIAIISVACFAALIFHIGALYLLHGFQMDFYSTKKALMEHQLHSSSDEEEIALRKEESQRRNEQLASLFQEIPPEEKEPEHLNYDIKNLKTEFFSGPVELVDQLQNPSRDALVSLEANVALELESEPTLELHSEGKTGIDQELSHQQKPDDLLFPNDKGVAEELVRAAERAEGSLSIESEEPLDLSSLIKAGAIEDSSIAGTLLENRSGMISEGRTDVHHSADLVLGILKDQSNLSDGKETAGSDLTPHFNNKLEAVGTDAIVTTRKDRDLFEMQPLSAVPSSDDFIIKVSYSKKNNGLGYLFRLELSPKEDAVFRRITQNIFFLIDRSHSIRTPRYEASKVAVMHALGFLKEGDTFNILVFDNHVVKMSQENLPWTSENMSKARQFLAEQKHGGLFASTDLYKSLGNIVPDSVKDNEVNTAILLSDGDTFLSKEQQRGTIADWTKQNAGKISLFGVASGEGNNLPLLDILSSFNKGSLYYASTDIAIDNTLTALMRAIQHPIAKDIVATAVLPNAQTAITLYPSIQWLPNLYQNKPYVIYGSITDLNDFHIFFQGKYYDKWVDIKQLVSFKDAHPVTDHSLETMWAIQQAYSWYEKYLKDGSKAHLDQAKQVLSPYRIPVAFQ